jgi:hypothetical protein
MPSTLGLATNPHHRSSMREGVNTYDSSGIHNRPLPESATAAQGLPGLGGRMLHRRRAK